MNRPIPDLSAAWRRHGQPELPAPTKLPDERAITDLYTPVIVEFLGIRKRLVFAADQRLPRDCPHSLACAAELANELVEPVSGVRAAATSGAQTLERTQNLRVRAAPTVSADPPAADADLATGELAAEAMASAAVAACGGAR